MKNEIGKTKDVGYELGVRKPIPFSSDIIWSYFFSEKGIKIWLGELTSNDFEVGQLYKTRENIEGIIKVIKPYSHLRLTRKKKDWNNSSTLQVRFIIAKSGTTVSFHQEKLLNSKQREEMKDYWNGILDRLIASIS
ncbi:MAG: ATPase [Methanophagales archaeon ANME-1-THS]|nr:MAG: ATPase [Methanophagales archaeon ANME-1-THS]